MRPPEAPAFHIGMESPSATSLIENNILAGPNRLFRVQADVYDDLAAFRGRPRGDVHPVPRRGSEARVRVRFSLVTVEPAIDRGLDLAELNTAYKERYGVDMNDDIEGIARPQGAGWDVGGSEYLPR